MRSFPPLPLPNIKNKICMTQLENCQIVKPTHMNFETDANIVSAIHIFVLSENTCTTFDCSSPLLKGVR